MDDYGDDNSYAGYSDDDDDTTSTSPISTDDDYEDDLDDFTLPDEDLNGLNIADKEGNMDVPIKSIDKKK